MKTIRFSDEFLADMVQTAQLALLAPLKLTSEQRLAVCGVLMQVQEQLFEVPSHIEGSHQRWKDCKYVASELENCVIPIGIDRQQQLANMLDMTAMTLRPATPF